MKRTSTEAVDSLYSGPHVALFLTAWAAVQVAIPAIHFPDVLGGAQLDSDGYFRLLRVEHLLNAGAWFDSSIPGSNWPHGEVTHWTRPLDVLMIILAAPFMMFFSVEGAVAVSGSLISALLHGVLCIAGVWVISPIVSSPARFLVMPALLAQPGVFAYGSLGRADHHILVLLLAFLGMGAWLRALLKPEDSTPPRLAGLLMALALWVSPEALIPLAVIFAIGGFAWIITGNRYRSANMGFAVSFAVVTLVAILIERSPRGWLTVEFDRISIAHLTMAVIAVGFWLMAPRVLAIMRDGQLQRGAIAALGGLVSALLLHLLHPGFFRGPGAHADPRLNEIFFPFVNELQPILPTDLTTTGEAVTYLGAGVVALPYAVYRTVRVHSTDRRSAWLFLVVAVLLLVAMAMWQRRLMGYAGVALALVLTSLLSDAIEWADKLRSPTKARFFRMGSMLGLLVGFLLVGSGISYLGDSGGATATGREATLPVDCNVQMISDILSDPDGLGATPRTIVASPNVGPELLYRTPHRILAGPYHRNVDGMAAIVDFFTSPDPDLVQEILHERQVGVVLLCPASDGGYFVSAGTGPGEGALSEKTLYSQLTGNRVPDWLEPVEFVEPQVSGFLLYRVR